ncbi:MAG: hypothetical protein A2Y77_12520 [Planctomycetes bacterium RBG_13_62_9]|nr:MAG: hypothetical protein A2Y77_12520 [Planctomycetes bacterium RBG_13_62_9]
MILVPHLAILISADRGVQPGHLLRGRPDLAERRRTPAAKQAPRPNRCRDQDRRRDSKSTDGAVQQPPGMMGGIVKRSSAMASLYRGETIAKAFGLDDATLYLALLEGGQHLPPELLAVGGVRLGVDLQTGNQFSEFLLVLGHLLFSMQDGLGFANMWHPRPRG